MIFNYKNIEFSFTKYQYPDFIGAIEFEISKSLIQEYYKYYDCIPYDIDYIIKDDDYFGIYADVLIVFINWCFKQEDRQFKIKVKYSNIFWLIHDCLHAEEDVTGSEVYVSKDVEEDRLIETFEYLKDNNMDLPNIIEIEEIENSFYERWKQRINLEQYKQLEL